jgi:hypothetical protein
MDPLLQIIFRESSKSQIRAIRENPRDPWESLGRPSKREKRPLSDHSQTALRAGFGQFGAWKSEEKGRSVLQFALYADVSSVRNDDMFHDCEP